MCPAAIIRASLAEDISVLDLSVRAHHCLLRAGVTTIGNLDHCDRGQRRGQQQTAAVENAKTRSEDGG